MNWREACINSSNRTAFRFDCFLNTVVYRHLDGDAYYFNGLGELKLLSFAKVEGFHDWKPDGPLEEVNHDTA